MILKIAWSHILYFLNVLPYFLYSEKYIEKEKRKKPSTLLPLSLKKKEEEKGREKKNESQAVI